MNNSEPQGQPELGEIGIDKAAKLTPLLDALKQANIPTAAGIYGHDDEVHFMLPGDRQPEPSRVLYFEAQHLVEVGIENLSACSRQYHAIFNKELREVECLLTVPSDSDRVICPRLWELPDAEIFDDFQDAHSLAANLDSGSDGGLYSVMVRFASGAVGWRLLVEQDGLEIEISPMSRALYALSTSMEQIPFSIKVRNTSFDFADARDALLGPAGDFLFNLNLVLGLNMQLKPRGVASAPVVIAPIAANVRFPKFQYSRTSRELYWYASAAINFPLIQYLAYYQVLEHNFYRFSRQASIKRARNHLQNPRFDTTNDSDIAALISAVEAPSTRRQELDLLTETLEQSLDQDALLGFYRSEAGQPLTDRKRIIAGQTAISLSNDGIFRKTAENVYALRNRIVHTKEFDGRADSKPLTPSSPDLLRIGPNISLLQWLAQCVLISSATHPSDGSH